MQIKVAVNHVTCVEGPMVDLRAIWEETSYRLERLQCNPDCALQEYQMLQLIAKTPYRIAFEWRHLTEQNGWTNGVQKTSTGSCFERFCGNGNVVRMSAAFESVASSLRVAK